MYRRVSSILFSYAFLLLVAGLFSTFYNPQRVLGWNPHGISGLIACGTGAVLALVFGLFDKKGAGWALWAGLILSFLFLCQTGSSSFKSARGMETDPTLWFKLSVNLLACFASLRAFIFLGLIARHRKNP